MPFRAFVLEIPDLLDVAIVVTLQFICRVAPKFLHDFLGDDEGYHGLGCDSSSRDDADIGALIACAGGFPGIEADGLKRTAQR